MTDIQAVAIKSDSVVFWTTRCRRDAANLTLAPSDVGELIQKLRGVDYLDSEWCENGKGIWAACDAYQLVRDEPNDWTGKVYRTEYFLKFALGRTGTLLLMVSCHLSS
ncbi:MAG: hypothetical protein JNM61_08700 [Zoogloeaceae bacterium]|nr:hypothetical protein [Zoogloeaceae bacterium]